MRKVEIVALNSSKSWSHSFGSLVIYILLADKPVLDACFGIDTLSDAVYTGTLFAIGWPLLWRWQKLDLCFQLLHFFLHLLLCFLLLLVGFNALLDALEHIEQGEEGEGSVLHRSKVLVEKGNVKGPLEQSHNWKQLLEGGGCLVLEGQESDGSTKNWCYCTQYHQNPADPVELSVDFKANSSDHYNGEAWYAKGPILVPCDDRVTELFHLAHGDRTNSRQERAEEKEEV